MENGHVLPRLLVSSQGAETASQMFGIVDDVAGNFAEELANAKSSNKSESHKKEVGAHAKKEQSEQVASEKTENASGQENVASTEEEAPLTEQQPVLTEEVAILDKEVEIASEEVLEDGIHLTKITEEAPVLEEAAIAEEGKQGEAIASSEEIALTAEEDLNLEAAVAEELPVEEQEVDTAASPEIPEEALEGFHDIIPEKEQKKSPLNKIEPVLQKKIMANLQRTAAATNVQPPVAERVSPQLLEGLKTVNAELARQVETARPIAQPQAAANSARTAARSPYFQPSQAQKSDSSAKLYTHKFTEIREKVVEQVRFSLKSAATKSGQKISIRLHPRFLGVVDVQLTIEENRAQAQFLVENQSTRELLQRSQSELQRALKEQGIDIEEVEIDLADRDGQLGQGGGAFASAEEQEAARNWLASFHNLSLQRKEEGYGNESNAQEAGNSSDEILNILA